MADMKILTSLIMGFAVVVIGLAFLNTSSDTISEAVDDQTVTRSIALVNDSAVVVIGDTANTLTSVNSITQGAATLTVTTHYTVDLAAETVNLTGVTYGNGTYNVSMTYQDENYISDSAARSTTGLIRIMFALAIFLSILTVVNFREFGLGKN